MSETGLPQNKQLPWENAINRQLQQRLLRPLLQPGLINTSKLARTIILRSQSLSERLPLLAQINQRWSSVRTQAVNDIPLVYAQFLPSQDNSVKTLNSLAGSSRTNLQVTKANPLSTSGNIGGKFNLLETTPVVKGQSRSIPTVQAKFTSDNQSNLISQAHQTDLSMSKEGNQKSTDIFPGIQESGNLEKVLSPKYSVDLININRNVYLGKISHQELPLISAKLDLPLQSPDILSLNYLGDSVENNSRESEFPLVKIVKITPESNFTPTERTSLLLNQITVEQALISDDKNSTIKTQSIINNRSSPLSNNRENVKAEVSDNNRLTSQPTVQAKFISDNQSNLISQAHQTDLSMSKEGNQKSTDIFPGIQESGNLENVLSPNYSGDLININRNVYLGRISHQELPLISAKLDLPLQSPDILSLNYLGDSVENNSRKSELPLVKITTKSNFTPTERTALLLNQISVDQALMSEDSQPLVIKNLVSSWQGLDTELLLPIAPLKSYKTVAANEREDLVNKQYNLGEKSKNPKTHEVAIAKTVTHTASNNSTRLPIQTQEAFPTQTDSKNQVDLDSLADKVERKLMRRLAIESERRGQKRWR